MRKHTAIVVLNKRLVCAECAMRYVKSLKLSQYAVQIWQQLGQHCHCQPCSEPCWYWNAKVQEVCGRALFCFSARAATETTLSLSLSWTMHDVAITCLALFVYKAVLSLRYPSQPTPGR